MTTFPGSPKLLKGAIVGIDLPNLLASVILFQYNSDTLTRTLQAQTAGGEGGDYCETLHPNGAPVKIGTRNGLSKLAHRRPSVSTASIGRFLRRLANAI